MGAVRFFPGQPDTDNDDDTADHIGSGMDRVADHSAGMCQDPCEQLEYGQYQVPENADQGNPYRSLLLIHIMFCLSDHFQRFPVPCACVLSRGMLLCPVPTACLPLQQ